MVEWQNRIIAHGIKAASQFMANPANPRIHPAEQRAAVKDSLDALGWVKPVIELQSGYLLDGHERVWQALSQGDDTPVPYMVVDLTEAEADEALLTLDFMTAMAKFDRSVTLKLMEQVKMDRPVLQKLIATMAENEKLFVTTHGGSAAIPHNGEAGGSGGLASDVRMVYLFFDVAQVEAFSRMTKTLSTLWQTSTVTDTVLEAVKRMFEQEANNADDSGG
jgi:hypothetical protein